MEVSTIVLIIDFLKNQPQFVGKPVSKDNAAISPGINTGIRVSFGLPQSGNFQKRLRHARIQGDIGVVSGLLTCRDV